MLTLTPPGYAAEGTVRGAVFDDAGHPLSGALVRLDGPIHVSAITGQDGAFAFASVPDGRFAVTVTKAGYVRVLVRGVTAHTASSHLAHLTMHPAVAGLKVIGSVVARERMPFNNTPAALKVFPREAYRDQGQAALSAVLAQTPGAIVARAPQENAAQPLAPYAVTIRGGLPWETATTIDGNPVALPSDGAFDLAYVPSFVLQDVELVKGYGTAEAIVPGSVDGALNLRTAEPAVARKALLEVEGDTHGGQFSDLAYGGTAPGGRFSFAAMLSADGNPGPVPDLDAAGGAFQRSQLLKGRYALSPAVTGTLTYLGSQGTLGVAVARGFTTPAGFASFANSSQAQESHRLGLYSIELHADAGEDAIAGKAFAMRLQRTGSYDEFAFPGIGSGLNAVDDVAGVSLQDDRQIAGNLYQLQISHRAGHPQAQYCPAAGACATLIPGGARSDDTTIRAAALLHPTRQTDLQFAAAELWMRERYSNDSGANYLDRTVAVPAFHAGAAFHVRSNLTVRAAVGSGAAAPPAAMLNVNPSQLLIQTPVNLPPYLTGENLTSHVTPETSFGYDAGVEYRLHGGNATLSADVYRTRIHNGFLNAGTRFEPYSYTWYNAGPLTHQGAEISLQQFKRVGLGYIVQASFLDNTPVPGPLNAAPLRVPFSQGYAEISYKWPRGSRASLGALYTGANNVYVRPAFTQFNANLELSLNDYCKLQLSAQNLTNVYAGTLPTYAYPLNLGTIGPRTFRIMFRQSIGGTLYER